MVSSVAEAVLQLNTTHTTTSKRIASTKTFTPHQFDVLKIILVGGHAVIFSLCIMLICYLRYQRNIALHGDPTAARKLILPSFEPLIWIIAGVTGAFAFIVTTIHVLKVFKASFPPVLAEAFYGGRQFVFVVVIILLLQRSITRRALRRTVIISFGLASYTIPIRWYMAYHGNPADTMRVLTLTRTPLLLLYTFVFIFPPSRANRVALRQYCVYVYVYFLLQIINTELFPIVNSIASFVVTVLIVVWGSLCPLVIWRVLRADTEHWRGFGKRAGALQNLFRQRNNLMDEYVSSEGLHVLIEMHSSHMIDFAYLKIRRRIGVGATAVIFNGLLKSKIPVAIKVYAPSVFDEDTVAEFSHEAALCAALCHPNIVTFYGMCISPPTICLVYELCLGSLEDIMTMNERQEQREQRRKLLIQLGYMLDAARAVAYLHSFSPPFLHRDLKPANFVVDVNGSVKLTDFGESRSVAREATVRRLSYDGTLWDGFTHDDDIHRACPPVHEDRLSAHDWDGRSMTVCGTVDYMAPEVINGRTGQAEYGAAANVYSLAITFWDILHPGRMKFPVSQNHMKIFECVLDGGRPTVANHVPPSLRELLELAWQHEPEQRPHMRTIVKTLESMQEEAYAVLACELRDMVAPSIAFMGECVGMAPIERSFTGTQLTALMTHDGIVASTGEAIRMGNALMDTGLLHHLHHERAFTNSDSAYYLDDDNISLNQPLGLKHNRSQRFSHRLPSRSHVGDGDSGGDFALVVTPTTRPHRRTRGSSSDYESFYSNSSSNQPVMQSSVQCACRKLGQGVTLTKNSWRRRRRDRRKGDARNKTREDDSLNVTLLSEHEMIESTLDDFAEFDHVAIDIASE